MPEALKYNIDMNNEYNTRLDSVHRQESVARQQRIDRLWRYYDGDHAKPTYADGKELPKPIIVNTVELIADKSVASMLGIDESGIIEGVQFQIPQPDSNTIASFRRTVRQIGEAIGVTPPLPNQVQQSELESLWEANNKNLFLTRVMLTAAITGHVYIKMLPDGVDLDGRDYTRFVLLDTRNVSKFWDAADVERTLWYRVQYNMPDVGIRKREDIVRNVDDAGNDLGSWTIYTFEQMQESGVSGKWGKWQAVGEPILWAYKFAPIVDWQNLPPGRGCYGKDDFGVTTQLNDALNTNVSITHQIALNYSYPRYFGTGIDNIKQEDEIDGIWFTPNENASMNLLEMQGDLVAIREFGGALRRMIFDQGRELDPSTVQDQLGNLTNFALRVLNDDRLGKRAVKWLSASSGLSRLSKYALEMQGMLVSKIDVIPPDPLPTDPLTRAQAFALHRANGLSQDTYLEKQGFDPSLEARNKDRERTNTARDQLSVQQSQLADSLEQRGQLTDGTQ